MKLITILLTLVMLALPYSLQAQEATTSIAVWAGGALDDMRDFTAHFAVGSITPIDENFSAVAVFGYQKFSIPEFDVLGDEEEFYLEGLIRWTAYNEIFLEVGGALTRLDYTSDNTETDTYGTGKIGIGKEWNSDKWFKYGVSGGLRYTPGKMEEVGTTTITVNLFASFDLALGK